MAFDGELKWAMKPILVVKTRGGCYLSAWREREYIEKKSERKIEPRITWLNAFSIYKNTKTEQFQILSENYYTSKLISSFITWSLQSLAT